MKLGPDNYRPENPDSPFIVVHDLVNPETGNTYREDNLAKHHNIPIGALVEIVSDKEDPSEWDGLRLFVVRHHRDCDGTPLYGMSFDRDDLEDENPKLFNRSVLHGFPEDSLSVVQPDSPDLDLPIDAEWLYENAEVRKEGFGVTDFVIRVGGLRIFISVYAQTEDGDAHHDIAIIRDAVPPYLPRQNKPKTRRQLLKLVEAFRIGEEA